VKRDRCKTCGAEIIWAETERGRPMPVDAKPLKVILLEDLGELFAPKAKVVNAFVSHFATCPDAAEHRRPAAPR
jgi:hypothetical protein